MIRNLHTHTLFCDGENSAEELVLKAIELGIDELGFSGHSYTFFDESYCMSKQKTVEYKQEIHRLKEKYNEKIKILLGIEQDYYSNEPTDDYDYVIGSVHYVKKGEVYIPIDESKEILENAVKTYYNGDIYALIEDYYLCVSDIFNKTKCDIIGHFDLITKFNENNALFDENNERYIRAVDNALEKLFETDAIFEVNTGGMARGYKKTPYPSQRIIEKIKNRKKKLLFSSDCHNKEQLLYGFDLVEKLID